MHHKVIKDKAETIEIQHPTASYGIFCYNSKGDLFLNADWGFMGFSWRAYGENFKEFLKKCNAEYIAGKFAINWNNQASKTNRMSGRREKMVTELIECFLQALRDEEAPVEVIESITETAQA